MYVILGVGGEEQKMWDIEGNYWYFMYSTLQSRGEKVEYFKFSRIFFLQRMQLLIGIVYLLPPFLPSVCSLE